MMSSRNLMCLWLGLLGLWVAFGACEPEGTGKETPGVEVSGELAQDASQDASAPELRTEPRPEFTLELPPEPPPFQCTMPKVPPLQGDDKATQFALTMFHYNIEYVVNGLNGTDKYKSYCGDSCDVWDNDKVEDWIVRESFVPVVDFYLKHPTWKVNFEMQGYMLEVIAQRFPEVLEKLRTLTGRGQMEISSFHYSDQLFLAFPRADLERSIALTKAIFQRYCIPLSGVVFNQEGQAGEGRQQLLVKQGYTIGVFPKNLFKYVRGDSATPWPLYQQYGGHLIVGPGEVDPASKINVNWLFFDDGELLSIKGKLNPYFAPGAQYDPTTMVAYEKKIQGLVDQGYKIAHISEYVASLQAQKLEVKPAPRLLDGTWQPKSTASIHRWMGGKGLFPDEQDNAVRAGNMQARVRLRATELLYLDWKQQKGADAAIEARLAYLWRRMMRAQVSDASGVNPWAGEIYWGLQLNAEILQESRVLIDYLKELRGVAHVSIQLKDGKVTTLASLPKPPPPTPAEMPLKGVEIVAEGRTHKLTVTKVDGSAEQYRMQIDFSAGVDERKHRSLMVRFPRTHERIVYSPGLMEDQVVDYPLSDFVFQTQEVFLPLSNGLIGLGSDWYVIKHVQRVHIAARIPQDNAVIEFIDNTQPYDQPVTWIFDLVKGSQQQALAQALSLNIFPTVID